MKHYHLALFVCAASLAGFAMTAGASAQTSRVECRATGATDISMQARYEVRGTGTSARRKFSTEFEAGPRTGLTAGTSLSVAVKGVTVGSVALEALVGGGTVADLNFDTRPQIDALPFPANWPANVGRGTAVTVSRGTTQLLGCTLR